MSQSNSEPVPLPLASSSALRQWAFALAQDADSPPPPETSLSPPQSVLSSVRVESPESSAPATDNLNASTTSLRAQTANQQLPGSGKAMNMSEMLSPPDPISYASPPYPASFQPYSTRPSAPPLPPSQSPPFVRLFAPRTQSNDEYLRNRSPPIASRTRPGPEPSPGYYPTYAAPPRSPETDAYIANNPFRVRSERSTAPVGNNITFDDIPVPLFEEPTRSAWYRAPMEKPRKTKESPPPMRIPLSTPRRPSQYMEEDNPGFPIRTSYPAWRPTAGVDDQQADGIDLETGAHQAPQPDEARWDPDIPSFPARKPTDESVLDPVPSVDPSVELLEESLSSRASRSSKHTPSILPTHRTSSRRSSPHLPYSEKDPDPGYMASVIDGNDTLQARYRAAATFVGQTLPRQIYLHLLLRLPSLYFSRVARIFEEADLTLPEIKKMALETASRGLPSTFDALTLEAGIAAVPPQYERLKTTWEEFIDSVMREWKTFNIISVLLLSCVPFLNDIFFSLMTTPQGHSHYIANIWCRGRPCYAVYSAVFAHVRADEPFVWVYIHHPLWKYAQNV